MKRHIPDIVLTSLFILFSFWILAVKNGFMLRWYDEMSLFEPGSDSLRQFLLYPGGIFRFAGTYLTQLLYYPALGSCVLIFIWLLIAWLTKIAFRLRNASVPLCFLVPFCMLVSILHLDEAYLNFESQGYVFYNSLGFTFSLAVIALFSTARRTSMAQEAIAIILPLLYPVAGYFALLPAIICSISLLISSIKNKKTFTIVASVLSILFVVVIPLLYYRYCNGTTVDNDYLYLKGLPELTMEDYDWYLWQPFAIASILLLMLSLLSSYDDLLKFSSSKIIKYSSWGLFLLGILLSLSADSKKSEQLRATVLMVNAIENHDWKKVTHIMSLTKESPNYTMCVLDNLARAYCRMERRSTGNMMTANKDFRHNEDFTINTFVDVPVNHYIGRFNQSHRWATENNVLYGNRAYYIKYIVRNAILNGNLEFAKKYNQLLMRTMFHRQWAQEMNKYIENPELINTLPDFGYLMALRAEEIMRGE
ncbi:MAG: hypothetical protein K2K25_08510 [Muribaculaceae bacterium]|nr:hypothetical protein [Muribaculaceae bacterium]